MIVRKHFRFTGKVQGVGFRYRAKYAANGMGITGWAKNEYDGSVEMEAQGTEKAINKMLVMINKSDYITLYFCTHAFHNILSTFYPHLAAQPYRHLYFLFHYKLKREEKLAIVLGTEGDGLAVETIASCDYTVRIPMANGVDSLNVAAASAVAFWQLV